MPCDQVNKILEESGDKVVWRRNICVHKKYWEEVGGDINVYYLLREAFLRGFLSGISLVYEKVDEAASMIKRSGINE